MWNCLSLDKNCCRDFTPLNCNMHTFGHESETNTTIFSTFPILFKEFPLLNILPHTLFIFNVFRYVKLRQHNTRCFNLAHSYAMHVWKFDVGYCWESSSTWSSVWTHIESEETLQRSRVTIMSPLVF